MLAHLVDTTTTKGIEHSMVSAENLTCAEADALMHLVEYGAVILCDNLVPERTVIVMHDVFHQLLIRNDGFIYALIEAAEIRLEAILAGEELSPSWFKMTYYQWNTMTYYQTRAGKEGWFFLAQSNIFAAYCSNSTYFVSGYGGEMGDAVNLITEKLMVVSDRHGEEYTTEAWRKDIRFNTQLPEYHSLLSKGMKEFFNIPSKRTSQR